MQRGSKRRSELKSGETQPATKRQNVFYTEEMAVEETSDKIKIRQEKARTASAAMRAKFQLGEHKPVAIPVPVEEPIFLLPVVSGPLSKGIAASRRSALEYIFLHVCGAPEQGLWLRDGIVNRIMRVLMIPRGSSAEVKKVFLDVLAARAAKRKYDVHCGERLRGRKPLITDCTPQAEFCYRALESGLSTTQTAVILNMWRLARNLPAVSWSAVNGFVERIAFWDENHKKVMLGHTSKWENRIARNLPCYGKEPTSVLFGGVLPAKSMRTTIKFPGEARGLFGCALVEQADGSHLGVKAVPYCYTNKFVIGIKKWNEKKKAEELRVLPKKGAWTNDPTYGYRQRYGVNWEQELEAVLGRKGEHGMPKVCITSLIDHVISESKRMYAGTPYADSFIIFHNGLSQWWEKEAQDYIRALSFGDRQLRYYGDTNKGNRYHGKLSMAFHTSLSSTYPEDDPRRFGMGTPPAVWRTMTRCWEMEPTSDRLVEDIMAFEHVLGVVVEHRGCVVADKFLRTGRRARRSDGKANCKNKPRTSQRKTTLVSRPCHPDCVEARNKIMGLVNTVADQAIEAVDEAAAGLLMLMDLHDVQRGGEEEEAEDP
ncbi:hypothetical protein B484DRAFT_465573 [Ochromonadaceae sp. CCMP2298]|nr:hypothetical protein B484DRAFT_465573 [Ochromonadaceae sp. CCMP2298]